MPECSICTAPAYIRNAVDVELSRRTRLRDIAKMTHLSKSAIHRHSKRCVSRTSLQGLHTARFNPELHRVLTRWPNDPVCTPDVRGKTFVYSSPDPADHHSNPIPPDQLRPTDILLVVEYDKPAPTHTHKPLSEPTEAAGEDLANETDPTTLPE